MESVLLDAAGRRRSPATVPGFHSGRPPRNKGRRYPPDPPTVEEIIAVMRTAGIGAEGVRLRAFVVMLWRAGLRISEALALAETDLDPVRGAVLVRAGKGGRRREVGMDRWAWEQLRSTCGASITEKSSTPSTSAEHPSCPRPPDSESVRRPRGRRQGRPLAPRACTSQRATPPSW
jgi:integrase